MADLQLVNNTIECIGDWTIHYLPNLEKQLNTLKIPNHASIVIDTKQLSSLDSGGAWLLQCIISKCQSKDRTAEIINLSEPFQTLFSLASAEKELISETITLKKKEPFFYHLGKNTVKKSQQSLEYLGFIGQLTQLFTQLISRPKIWHINSISSIIQDTGINALPIIGLLSFLIGVVLAYQLGLQLKLYGANIYIVSLSGMAILREFGPLITAIIVAGRTTSSFTAQLGLMKVNEEMDALYAMGISPINRLALPRLIGVIIVFPLLTIWANAFGMIGSMLMSDYMLDIRPIDFINRFTQDIEIDSLWTGLSKAPVFGMLVASIGCFQGFQVSYSATSIGQKTTLSVVQAIFLVIIADAFFSVLFSWAGI